MSIKKIKDEIEIATLARDLEMQRMNDAVQHSELWRLHTKAYTNLAIEVIELEQRLRRVIVWRWVFFGMIVLTGLIALICLK